MALDRRLRLWLDWSCGRGASQRGYCGLGGVWRTQNSDIPRLWVCAQLRRSGGGHTSWDGLDSTAFSQPHYWGSQPTSHSNLHTGQRVNSSPSERDDRERWREKGVYDYRQATARMLQQQWTWTWWIAKVLSHMHIKCRIAALQRVLYNTIFFNVVVRVGYYIIILYIIILLYYILFCNDYILLAFKSYFNRFNNKKCVCFLCNTFTYSFKWISFDESSSI